MANPLRLNKLEKDFMVPAPDLHHLLATGTNHHNDVALERLIRLNSLYGKDAPRDLFIATSASLESSKETEAHSDKRKTYPANTSSIESTDSEKAVKGSDDESPTDVQANSQEATVKELAGHIPNDSSDEVYRGGKEVRISRSDFFLLRPEPEPKDILQKGPFSRVVFQD